ncbi:MAG: VCBS repeat-containing protein, partial [Opitutaceae bacterium]
DAEPTADPVSQAFLLRREGGKVRFEPRQIDAASGIGVQLVAADADGAGLPDIVSAKKRGTVVFLSAAAAKKK